MRIVRIAWVLALVAVSSTRPARAEDEPPAAERYVDPVAFGPANVAFPWHAAFSPDGKWVGFSDGYTSYVEIWDVAKGARVWPTDGVARRSTHRVAFSPASDAMAFVDGERIVVVRLKDCAWRQAEHVTLTDKPPISLKASPLRLAFRPSGLGLVLTMGDRALQVDLTCMCVEDLTVETDILTAFAFADGSVAVGREKGFVTHVMPRKEEAFDVPGVLLESDPKGATWLVAGDARRSHLGPLEGDAEARLALEIRDACKTSTRASFQLVGKRSPATPYPHRLLIAAEFSPDAKVLATVEGSGLILLRDTTTAETVQTIREYEQSPYAMGVAFSPDGERMITGGRRSTGPKCLLWKRRAK